MSNTPTNSTDIKLSAYPQIDENKYPDVYNDLQTVHSAIRLMQQYLDAYTGARFIGRASAAINIGQLVATNTNYSDIVGVSLANATTQTLPCVGFATNSATAGQGIDVQTTGIYPYGAGALVPGTIYYLNTTSGQLTPTRPVGAGKLVQFIGVAIDTNNILFRPSRIYSEL